MYLIIVALLLIFLTMFYSMREGVENILDKSTILATETEVQLPNRVSGSRGDDITFAGNINLEHKHAVELGKGLEKGPNAGKLRYNHNQLEIFGAGQTDESYKIKLWDNVEVGGLLQSDTIQLGNDNNKGGIEYDKTNQKVHLKGYGTDGTRKVKIWDEVEVGQLLAKSGIDVYGPLTANDVSVKGKLFAKNGMSVVGDVEIVGNINNIPLNNRISQLEKRVTQNQGSTLDTGVVPSIQKQVNNLADTVNQNVLPSLGGVQSQMTDISNQVNKGTSETVYVPVPANSGSANLAQFNASFEDLKKVMDQKIATATNSLLSALAASNSSNSSSTNMTETQLNIRLTQFNQDIQNISSKTQIAYDSAEDWKNIKGSIFNTSEKITAWSNINPSSLNRLSGLTERQINNLAPLNNANFSKDFLQLGNNASHDYELLSNMINSSSDDYFRDLDRTVYEYILPGMSSYDSSLNDLYPFYTEWYDVNGGFDNASNQKISKIDYAYDRLDELMDASVYFNASTINASLRNVSQNASRQRDTMLANINTSFNNMSNNISTKFDVVNSNHTTLNNAAIKKTSAGDVIIPGKLTIEGQNLTLGKTVGSIWNFLAGPTNVGITKVTP